MSEVKAELYRILSEDAERKVKISKCKELLKGVEDPQEAMDLQVEVLLVLQDQAAAEVLEQWKEAPEVPKIWTMPDKEKERLDDLMYVSKELDHMPINDLIKFFLWYFADQFDEDRLHDAKGKMQYIAFKVLLTKYNLEDRWESL